MSGLRIVRISLRAITKPALMTFSYISAITFYLYATFTIFSMFYIEKIFGLHTFQGIGITKRIEVCFSTLLSGYLVIISAKSGVILKSQRCCFFRAI